MIDIKDLQIGNRVLYQNKVVEIETIHIRGTVGVLDGHKDFIVPISCKDIESIEVTDELLLKLGFEKKHDTICRSFDYCMCYNDCYLEIRTTSNSIGRDWYCHIDNLSHITIGGFDFQYLHELQNGIRLITKGDLEANL